MLRRLIAQRLVHMRVEHLAGLRLDLLEAAPAQQVGQLHVDTAHALGHLGLLVVLRRVHRPLEVVEHGQELGHDRLGRPLHLSLGVARDALAVVVEVGRDAAQVVQVLLRPAPRLVQLRLDLDSLELGRLLGRRGRRALARICHYARSPLSSTTSASTISSSPA